MINKNSFPKLSEMTHNKWDAIIIGGGITGAGIFRDLAREGYQVLLIEQNDFSFGTSSRSSKLVHGGLRYLANAQFKVTYESVREREKLQQQYPNLISPLQFVLPIYNSYPYPTSLYKISLGIYDIFGSKWKHGSLTNSQIEVDFNKLEHKGLKAVLYYFDAEVDDSRLVYRVLREGITSGGIALNYCKCLGFLRTSKGNIEGVQIKDLDSKKEYEFHTQVIVNATGPWTDELRLLIQSEKVIRKLRGSHILFPQQRVPIQSAFTIFHPRDKRALFVIPWQGMTMVGTTDLDHPSEYEQLKPEPFMTNEEMEYLLEAINKLFPDLQINKKDIISSFAGLRPIVSENSTSPSKTSRAHHIFHDGCVFSIAGGKLTTFQKMAHDLIMKIQPYLPEKKACRKIISPYISNPSLLDNSSTLNRRLSGIYGAEFVNFLAESDPADLEPLANTPYTLAEVRWALRHEMVHHLPDLMLRRTRLGLITAQGGLSLLTTIQPLIKQELNWSEEIFNKEIREYKQLWKDCYSLPSQ